MRFVTFILPRRAPPHLAPPPGFAPGTSTTSLAAAVPGDGQRQDGVGGLDPLDEVVEEPEQHRPVHGREGAPAAAPGWRGGGRAGRRRRGGGEGPPRRGWRGRGWGRERARRGVAPRSSAGGRRGRSR